MAQAAVNRASGGVAAEKSDARRDSRAEAERASRASAESVAEVATPTPPPKSKRGLTVLLAVGALVGISGLGWYVMHRGLEDTDDAQVDADVTSIPARTAAVVQVVHFVENQAVKRGDLLVELDPEQAATRLAQAEANLRAAEAQAAAADADARVAELNARTNKSAAQAQVLGATSTVSSSKEKVTEDEAGVAAAQADFDRATTDLDRGKQLLSSGAIAQAQLDHYQATYNANKASLAQSKARLDATRAQTGQVLSQVQVASAKLQQASDVDVLIMQARARADAAHAQAATQKAARDTAALELSYTKIYAPADGTVSKKVVEVGQMANVGQTVAQLVPAVTPWITANFKETQLTRMKPGQPAEVEVDAFPGVELHGKVESFSSATGARFALLPPDNATGNYTKIVQRLPVRITLHEVPNGVSLRPGLSVIATVDTRK